MKFANVLVLFVSAMAVTALPATDLDEDAVQVEARDFDSAAFEVEARDLDSAPFEVEARAFDSATSQLEARGRLTKKQCKAACNNGQEAMEAVCRRIRRKLVRKLCWEVAAGVVSKKLVPACETWCDNYVR